MHFGDIDNSALILFKDQKLKAYNHIFYQYDTQVMSSLEIHVYVYAFIIHLEFLSLILIFYSPDDCVFSTTNMVNLFDHLQRDNG